MAKDQFYRTKPHVNVRAVSSLQQLGMTPIGARQVLNGQLVSNPGDRELLAEMLATLTNQSGSGGSALPYRLRPVRVTSYSVSGAD